MKIMGDTASAFEWANRQMQQYAVGDIIRYTWIKDSDSGWTDAYVARIVKIELGEMGFRRIKCKPSFVVEKLDDGKRIELITVYEAKVVQNLAGGHESSAYVSPFAVYRVDSMKGNWIKTGHWETPLYPKIEKLDNVEAKSILIKMKHQKEEKIRREKEREDQLKREAEEREVRKRKNAEISQSELDSLINELRNM